MTKDIQMIFQDQYASLNPRMTVADIIEEPLLVHNLYTDKKQRQERIYELLEFVGLSYINRQKVKSYFQAKIFHKIKR